MDSSLNFLLLLLFIFTSAGDLVLLVRVLLQYRFQWVHATARSN